LTAGKVIIIHPYVYRLYWYLEAYNVTSAITCRKTLVVYWISVCPLHHEHPGSNPGTTAQLSSNRTSQKPGCSDRELFPLKTIGKAWEEAEESAANREDWCQSVAQCLYGTG